MKHQMFTQRKVVPNIPHLTTTTTTTDSQQHGLAFPRRDGAKPDLPMPKKKMTKKKRPTVSLFGRGQRNKGHQHSIRFDQVVSSSSRHPPLPAPTTTTNHKLHSPPGKKRRKASKWFKVLSPRYSPMDIEDDNNDDEEKSSRLSSSPLSHIPPTVGWSCHNAVEGGGWSLSAGVVTPPHEVLPDLHMTGESSLTSPRMNPGMVVNKCVAFGTVTIREYDVMLILVEGDAGIAARRDRCSIVGNDAAGRPRSTVSMSLDWTYREIGTVDVDDYERLREEQLVQQEEQILIALREDGRTNGGSGGHLMNVDGYSRKKLRRAAWRARRVKRRRFLNRVLSSMVGVEQHDRSQGGGSGSKRRRMVENANNKQECVSISYNHDRSASRGVTPMVVTNAGTAAPWIRPVQQQSTNGHLWGGLAYPEDTVLSQGGQVPTTKPPVLPMF